MLKNVFVKCKTEIKEMQGDEGIKRRIVIDLGDGKFHRRSLQDADKLEGLENIFINTASSNRSCIDFEVCQLCKDGYQILFRSNDYDTIKDLIEDISGFNRKLATFCNYVYKAQEKYKILVNGDLFRKQKFDIFEDGGVITTYTFGTKKYVTTSYNDAFAHISDNTLYVVKMEKGKNGKCEILLQADKVNTLFDNDINTIIEDHYNIKALLGKKYDSFMINLKDLITLVDEKENK